MKLEEIRKEHATYRNPPRAAQPTPHYSRGRNLYPQRYMVGWADGIVKVGETWNGRARWGPFLRRGGIMLDLAFYEDLGHALHGEIWLQRQIRETYRQAFQEKAEAIPYMGPSGAGYLECYAIPPENWPEIVELARTVDALV